jgi:hypothetical protein
MDKSITNDFNSASQKIEFFYEKKEIESILSKATEQIESKDKEIKDRRRQGLLKHEHKPKSEQRGNQPRSDQELGIDKLEKEKTQIKDDAIQKTDEAVKALPDNIQKELKDHVRDTLKLPSDYKAPIKEANEKDEKKKIIDGYKIKSLSSEFAKAAQPQKSKFLPPKEIKRDKE